MRLGFGGGVYVVRRTSLATVLRAISHCDASPYIHPLRIGVKYGLPYRPMSTAICIK